MPKYKVIKQVDWRPRKHRRNDVPVHAIQLAEDVNRLERIIKDLESIDGWNITDNFSYSDRGFGERMLQTQIALVRSWHRYAKRKLQTEYLAP